MRRHLALLLAALPVLIGSTGLALHLHTKSSTSEVKTSVVPESTISSSLATHPQESINGKPVSRSFGSIMPISGLEDLIARADIIVIGKTDKSVTDVPAILIKDFEGFVHQAISEVPFKATKVFKGDPVLKTIRVGQQAAMVQQNGRMVVRVLDEYSPMEPGKKYLLFLKKGAAGTEGENLYFPLGVMYGKYNLDGTDSKEEATFPDPTFKEIKKAVKERFKE
ncbi:MAG: hypothetical protein KME43_25875 [Myxacorys chilensis ATA2-1-KO14]|jgi:hypothetical protein|nr:hypothetical protein [Myxacorys chilensis ATA2-1-KO14]